LDSVSICSLNPLHRLIDELAADALPPELFGNVHSIDNSNSATLDNRRNGFPIINSTDEKTGNPAARLGNKTKIIRLPEAIQKPLFHSRVGIRSQFHVGTSDILTIVEPYLLDLSQVFTAPFAYTNFHCRFHNKLR